MTRKLVSEQKHFIVIDNFLSESQHSDLFKYFKELEFQFVHTEKRIPAFKLTDGNPLWSEPILSHPYSKNTLCPVYPTGKPIDILMKEVIDLAEKNSHLIGERDKDWAYFFARPYIYPVGCGLNWHTDGKYGAPGAFVYYVHPEWEPAWGGELLISPLETAQPVEEECKRRSNWVNEHHTKIIMDHSVGHYILPKPNRLVLMTGKVFHTIKKVDPAAGDNLRMTVQGFFQDPGGTISKD